MITLLTNEAPASLKRMGSPIGRIDANTAINQSGATIDDGDEEETSDTDEDLDNEPLDEDGDPTGEHDHHHDDNYALGGHVTRSGSV